jgi:hypothetical protein
MEYPTIGALETAQPERLAGVRRAHHHLAGTADCEPGHRSRFFHHFCPTVAAGTSRRA